MSVVSDDQLLRVELVAGEDRRTLGLDDLDGVAQVLSESSKLNLKVTEKWRDCRFGCFFLELSFLALTRCLPIDGAARIFLLHSVNARSRQLSCLDPSFTKTGEREKSSEYCNSAMQTAGIEPRPLSTASESSIHYTIASRLFPIKLSQF